MAPVEVEITVDAVIVAVTGDSPRLLSVVGPGGQFSLPSGPLEDRDPTIELGLRRWIREQAGLEVGYAEQLYTFGDMERGPATQRGTGAARRLSIAYLALVREGKPSDGAVWIDAYKFLPWEDHRHGRPPVIDDVIIPALRQYVAGTDESDTAAQTERVDIVFGADGAPFDGVRALERYELMYEAGMVHESNAGTAIVDRVGSTGMYLDHRRIAATALSRLRGKLTYRPVVFELLPSRFTLSQLQRVVESLAGVGLHKQNFRRLVEGAGLVEGTGSMARTRGRPAELFRFRREVLRERPRPGVGTPWVHT